MGDNTNSIKKINEQISLLNRVPEKKLEKSNENNNEKVLFNDSDTLKIDKIDDLSSIDNVVIDNNYSDENKNKIVSESDQEKDDSIDENNLIFYIFIVILLIILCILLYILLK